MIHDEVMGVVSRGSQKKVKKYRLNRNPHRLLILEGMRMEHLLDIDLVRLAKKGEGEAFDILVQRYQTKVTHLVYRYVNNRETALDLVQDIFLKVYKNLVNFKGESKFSSWIFRVASNDCIDHLRKAKIRRTQSLDHYRESGFDVADPHRDRDVAGNYEAMDERDRVRKALNDLPEEQRAVVVLKIYQDMTFGEIAEILQEPVSTIKSRLYKALHAVGGILRQMNFIEKRGAL